MKTKSVILAALLATLSGCTPPKTIPFSTTTEFDSAGAKAMLGEGKNSLRGSAVMRQRDGSVVTCAGTEVRLVPSTAYTDERMLALYGNIEAGFNPAYWGETELKVKKEIPEYHQIFKQTTCDAQGFFKFNNLVDGSFYVISTMTWEVGSGIQIRIIDGGTLMQRVTVKGGESKEIVLTH